MALHLLRKRGTSPLSWSVILPQSTGAPASSDRNSLIMTAETCAAGRMMPTFSRCARARPLKTPSVICEDVQGLLKPATGLQLQVSVRQHLGHTARECCSRLDHRQGVASTTELAHRMGSLGSKR